MNDIWVTSCLHDLDLPENSFLIILILNGVFVNNFDGDFLIGRSVNSLLHFPKSPFT